MFVTHNQIYTFIACLAFGASSGILFSLLSVIKYFISNKYFKTLLDFVTFLCLSISFIYVSYYFEFPNVRVYMLIGVFIGLIGYFKSFHILLAKIVKKGYNIVVRKMKKIKRAKDDRIKVKKVNSRKHSGRGAVSHNFSDGNGISNNIHSGNP